MAVWVKFLFYSKSVAHARGRRRHPFISPFASLLLEMEEEGQQVTSYFTGQSIHRHSRVITYEPMDEMMDLGHPPTSEGNICAWVFTGFAGVRGDIQFIVVGPYGR